MGKQDQYEHSDAIHERATRHIARPNQMQFANEGSHEINVVRIDDYCPKCADVTVHDLRAKSLAHSGTTKCRNCGNVERA